MEITAILFLIGFIAVFGFLLYFAIQSNRKEKEAKQQIARSLGFIPFSPDPMLTERISRLYQRAGRSGKYELRNGFRKMTPDGEMYLFDLVETSGEDDSWLERQAVAVISPYLKLPPFMFFPRPDEKYALGGLTSKVMEWGLSFVGTPVQFPDFPEFNKRYSVASIDPTGVEAYFNDEIARYFAGTQMYTLHAGDDMFTFSELDPSSRTITPETISRRVNRALDIARILSK